MVPFCPSGCDFLIYLCIIYPWMKVQLQVNPMSLSVQKSSFIHCLLTESSLGKKEKKKIEATGACEAESLEPQIKPEPLDYVDMGCGSSRNP